MRTNTQDIIEVKMSDAIIIIGIISGTTGAVTIATIIIIVILMKTTISISTVIMKIMETSITMEITKTVIDDVGSPGKQYIYRIARYFGHIISILL